MGGDLYPTNPYPDVSEVDETQPWDVLHDGKVIATLPSHNRAFAWLLDHQGQSVAYALTYGGYDLAPARTQD